MNIPFSQIFLCGVPLKELINHRLFWGCVLLVMILIVGFSYLDCVIPPQVGWWQYYAWRMGEGDILYKDVYLFMPPYFAFLTRLLFLLFDNNFFLYTLLVGIPFKAACVWIMYRILCRMTHPFFACFSTFLGFCLSISYYQDMWYDFNPVIMLPCLIVAALMMRYYEQLKQHIVNNRISFIVGLLLSIICCLKQTVGLAYSLTAAIIVIVLIVREYEGPAQRIIISIFIALMGVLTGLLPLILYLSVNDCWEEFVYGILSIGQAKGGNLSDIFIRCFYAFSDHKIWVYILIIIALWKIQKHIRIRNDRSSQEERILILFDSSYYRKEDTRSFTFKWSTSRWILIITLLIICILALYPHLPLEYHNTFINNSFLLKWKTRIYLLLLYSGLLTWTFHMIRYFKHRNTNETLLIFTSFAIVHFLIGIISTDALEEIYFLMYIPWMLAYAFSAICPFKRTKDLFILFVIVLFSLQCFSKKITTPYSWQGWTTASISRNNVRCTVKGLEGFKLPSCVNFSYNQIINYIESYTTPEDRVFQFANIPLFNVLTKRATSGFAPITWFDVCPDDVAKKVALQLYEDPPKMIIWHNMNKANWAIAEKFFRGGSKSGQRDLQKYYKTFVMNNYLLLYQMNNYRDGYIELWIRK